MFDGDDAGVAAASRAAFVLAPLHLDLKVLLLPTGEDPDSFVRSRGAEAFREMAGQARDALDFVLEKAIAELQGDTARGKSAVLNHIKPLVSSMPDDILRGDFIRRTAEKLGIDERLARTRLRRDRPSSASSETRPGDFSAEYLGTREGNFIRVVLQNPPLIPRAREVISPEALTDRFSVDLYSIVLEEHDSRGTPVHLMDRVEDPEMRRVISRIMMVPPPPEESAEDELAHTMKYLMVKHLRARLSALRPRLKGRPELLSEQKRLSSLVQRIMSGEDIYRLCQNR